MFDTILRIYSAPGSLSGWRDAVHALNDAVGGKMTGYLLVNKQDLNTEIAASYGLSEADLRAYEGPHGAVKDVRFQYLHNLLPGRVFREFEYVTDKAAWDNSEWIQYQRDHLGCYWCMSARVSTHGLWDDFISVNRATELGPHTDEEKQALQQLLPHLARAAELHRTLTGLEQRYGAVLAALDYLLVGLVIVDVEGRVIVSNHTAQEVCDRSGALAVRAGGRLRATRPGQNESLQKTIAAAVATASGRGVGDGGQVVLGLDRPDVLAEVIPLRDDGLPDRDDVHGAAVFLVEPGLSLVVDLKGIAQIFRLTPSEHAVASALVNGLSIPDTAEQRNTSPETVRSQLKAVFSKTGASSQLELLRLAVKASPPIVRRP